MSKVLDDVRMRLVRAQEHDDEIKARLQATAKAREGRLFAYHQRFEHVAGDPNKIDVYVSILDGPDPYWGVIVGEVVNNCRAALDYIANALGIRGGYFPLYDSSSRFQREAVPKLAPLDPGDATLIESLQPYNATAAM